MLREARSETCAFVIFDATEVLPTEVARPQLRKVRFSSSDDDGIGRDGVCGPSPQPAHSQQPLFVGEFTTRMQFGGFGGSSSQHCASTYSSLHVLLLRGDIQVVPLQPTVRWF